MLVAPRVISNMDKKSKVVHLESSFTALNNAVKSLMIDERAKTLDRTSLLASDGTVSETAGFFLNKYFNVVKDCGTEPGECFATSYSNLNKATIERFPFDDESFYCVAIVGGTSICVQPVSVDQPSSIYLDVNGPAKPNIAGRDLFLIYLYLDGFVGDRVSDTGEDSSDCKTNSYGSGCFNRVINSGWVMDY